MKIKNISLALMALVFLLISAPLKAKETMLFVYYHDYAPFSWKEDDTMRGMYIDIVNEAFTNRLGIPVIHQGYPWVRAQKMVSAGQADGYCTTITPERLSFSAVTKESIIEVNFKIFTPAKSPRLEQLRKVKSIQELKDFKLADYSGSGWAEKYLSELDIHWLHTNDQIWNFLLKGRADASVKNEWTTNYILKQIGYQDKIIELPHPMNNEPIPFHIFIGKASSFVNYIDKLDDTLKTMKHDGTLKRIYDQYR